MLLFFYTTLSFFLSFLLNLVQADYMCSGVRCKYSNCTSCYQCSQDSTCTPANNCFCASKHPPGGLDPSVVPQFVFFTMDDSASTAQMQVMQNLDFIFQNPKIVDANGCHPKLSGYIESNGMDYNVVKWEDLIGSVGLHTITHTTGFTTTRDTWDAELQNNLKAIQIEAKVPTVYGSRAPYLAPNDNYFAAIKNLGILYDSSYANDAVFNNQDSDITEQEHFWPFTLDYGLPEPEICDSEGCLSSPVPGMWEFLLAASVDSNNQKIVPMNYPPESLVDIWNDFNTSFNRNRAPRGMYLHYNYFTVGLGFTTLDTNVATFVKTFYEWVSGNFSSQILFATEKDVIDWMHNPQPLSVTKTWPQFQCRDTSKIPTTACNWQRCSLLEGYLNVTTIILYCLSTIFF